MTNYYVKNPADGGSDNNTGQTWDQAWASPEKAMASCGSGDMVFCASDLVYWIGGTSDRYLGDYTNAGPGTQNNPVIFVSVVKDCQMPPQSSDYLKGARWYSNESGREVYLCGHTVWHGFVVQHPKFMLNDRPSETPIYCKRDKALFLDCTLQVDYEAGWDFSRMVLWDCILKYTYGTSYGDNIMYFDGTVVRGGSLDWQYTSASASLIHWKSYIMDIWGFNFSGLLSGAGCIGMKSSQYASWVVGGEALQQRNFSLRGCKIHTGGTLLKDPDSIIMFNRNIQARQRGSSFEENAISGLPAVNHQWIRTQGGTIEQSTDVKYYGRAVSDKYSWKLTSPAKGCYTYWSAISSPILSTWTGASSQKTYTIEILHDSVTNLKDDEVWMELRYSDNSGPMGKIITDRRTFSGTAADQAAGIGASAWTHNLSNPNSQKLSVTVTPVSGQPLEAVVYLAKASKTIYVDPVLRET